MKKSLLNSTILALLVTASSAALAESVTIPNTFTSGSTAVAAEVNGNFTAVKTAVDDNDSRITTNAAGMATNATGIATNVTGIATNATAIANKADASAVTANSAAIATKADASTVTTNATGIATNVTGIATNVTAIGLKANSSTVTALQTELDDTQTSVLGSDTTTYTPGSSNYIGAAADISAAVDTLADQVKTNEDAIAAVGVCPSDMVASGTLCVDKYEASVWDAATAGTQISGAGNAIYNTCSDTGDAGSANNNGGAVAVDCTDVIFARSVTGVEPAYDITQYQAAIACANVGKRLPTVSEWLVAAAGTTSGNGDGTVNQCYNKTGGTAAVRNTGEPTSCVSAAGAYDMVGNVWELTSDILLEGALALGTANTTNDMVAVGLGSDYLALGSTESIVDTFFIVPDDFGNFSLGFRCVK